MTSTMDRTRGANRTHKPDPPGGTAPSILQLVEPLRCALTPPTSCSFADSHQVALPESSNH